MQIIGNLGIKMEQVSSSLTYRKFSQVYDAYVLNRSFVEQLDYYKASKKRFWEAIRRIAEINLPPGSRVLDIGGGIIAVLAARLLGHQVMIGDVNNRAQRDIVEQGLDFAIIDLFSDDMPSLDSFDLVVLTEVIEHIPQPPYIVFGRISKLLAPGGRIFLTTPNGHRLRNLLYIALGKEILGFYRYPDPGMALGHQHEYTLTQLLWQAEHAGFSTERAEYYQDGFSGASFIARIAWFLTKPFGLVPYMRNGIVMVMRGPDQSVSTG